MSDHALAVIAIIIAASLALIGCGVAALSMTNHPDKAKTAKVFFSAASIASFFADYFWTVSTTYGLLGRVVVDIVWLTVTIGGLIVGFHLASRSSLADLSLPSSAFVSEPRPRNKKFISLAIISILAATALFNAIREAEAVTKWLWAHVEIVPWLPLLYFALGCGLTWLVFRIWYRYREGKPEKKSDKGTADQEVALSDTLRGCQDEWLHDIANRQANEIASYVELEKPYFINERLTDSRPSIGIQFPIRNYSIWEIGIAENIAGKVWLDGKELAEPFIVLHRGENIGFRQIDGVAIEQRLTKTEAEYLTTSKESYFDFQYLRLTVKGVSSQVKEQRLRITHEHIAAFREPPSEETEKIATLTAERDSLQSQLEKRDLLLLEVDTDLSFSANLQEVQSHVIIHAKRDGIKGRPLWAKIRVRFNNTNVNTNRICRLQFQILRPREGKEEQVPSSSSSMTVQRDSGSGGGGIVLENMEIPGSRMTEYYWLLYFLMIEDVSELDGAFIRITLEALRQPKQIVNLDVDWQRALEGNYSSLSPSVLSVRD